jgi:hypothetical protein
MKTMIKGTLVAALVASLTFASVQAQGQELIYGVDHNNNIFSIYSTAPSTLLSVRAINGLQSNEQIQGIDYWNGVLYGLGSFSTLYRIDPDSGIASQIGPFSPLLNGLTYGFDNQPAGVQVVSGLGQNLLLDRTTGAATEGPALTYAAGDSRFGVSPRVDALAYDISGSWFAADTLQDTLVTFDPTTGLLTTIGALGIDAARFNGLDISPLTGIMYLNTPASSSDPQANLYTVDKATGTVTLLGQIGAPGDAILVRGLAVVPEPGTLSLLALGLFGFLVARRRQ